MDGYADTFGDLLVISSVLVFACASATFIYDAFIRPLPQSAFIRSHILADASKVGTDKISRSDPATNVLHEKAAAGGQVADIDNTTGRMRSANSIV